jgi:hypothetical protein
MGPSYLSISRAFAPAQRLVQKSKIEQSKNLGTMAIGTWSPRARTGFPAAQAVTWASAERGIRADAFSVRSPFRPRVTRT